MDRLMIISCSSLKSNAPEALPTIDRYNGTAYKVIKKARREGYWPKNTHIFLVADYEDIQNYLFITTRTPKRNEHDEL